MALVTICPGCNTTFRVYSAQLQAHGGDVRCGRCQRVFNGFASLITVNETAIEHAASSQPAPQTAVEHAPSIPIDDPPFESDQDQESSEFSGDLFGSEPEKPAQPHWIILNFILLLLLIGQPIYHYRTELAIAAPQLRPYLERCCRWLQCTVPYPQQIKMLGIETSDLQKNVARQPEITTLRATIRNHASFPQSLPALQLLLLDAEGKTVASRIFSAADYLSEDEAYLPFIAPKQAIEARLDYDGTRLGALGYRLLLLYP